MLECNDSVRFNVFVSADNSDKKVQIKAMTDDGDAKEFIFTDVEQEDTISRFVQLLQGWTQMFMNPDEIEIFYVAQLVGSVHVLSVEKLLPSADELLSDEPMDGDTEV